METKNKSFLAGLPQKFLKSWRNSPKTEEKNQLRGLRIGFYPAKKGEKSTIIRFW